MRTLRHVTLAAVVVMIAASAFGWDCKPGDQWDSEHKECRPIVRIRIANRNLNSNTNDNSSTSTSGSTSAATGGTATANGTNTSTNANTANGNGSNSNNTTNNVAAAGNPANTAYAPTALPTVPCFKGMGMGAQVAQAGISWGSGKIDKNCQSLETARSFALHGSDRAYCKVMATTDAAKKAGVTFEDCMEVRQEPQPVPPPTMDQAKVEPPQIIVPAPQVTINLPPATVVASAPPPVLGPKPAVHKRQKPKTSCRPCQEKR